MGQIYICGAFSNPPNKLSRANSSTLGQPLPPAICSEFQHCRGLREGGVGGGGG